MEKFDEKSQIENLLYLMEKSDEKSQIETYFIDDNTHHPLQTFGFIQNHWLEISIGTV